MEASLEKQSSPQGIVAEQNNSAESVGSLQDLYLRKVLHPLHLLYQLNENLNKESEAATLVGFPSIPWSAR